MCRRPPGWSPRRLEWPRALQAPEARRRPAARWCWRPAAAWSRRRPAARLRGRRTFSAFAFPEPCSLRNTVRCNLETRTGVRRRASVAGRRPGDRTVVGQARWVRVCSSWFMRHDSSFWAYCEHQRPRRPGSSARLSHLVRVGLEVEEQRRQAGEVHVLVALVADHVQRALVQREAERALGAVVRTDRGSRTPSAPRRASVGGARRRPGTAPG